MSEAEKVMDYSSTRLAQEDMIPHEAVVKKLKKYAGQNYSKATGGKIFRTNPLKVLQYARAEVDGKTQTIYKFNRSGYDRCAGMEFAYQQKMKEKSKQRLLDNPIAKKKKGK